MTQDHDVRPPDSEFDRKLIAAQRVDPALRQRYEQEINAMLTMPLNRTRKVSFTLLVPLNAVMTVALALAALTSTDRPTALRVGLALGAIYAAGWMFMLIRILRRGHQQARTDVKWMSNWPWLFAVALMTILLIATGRRPDSVRSVSMLLYGLTFAMMASMFVVQYWINDARLKVEERLLETQLKLAELAEELRRTR